jgi:hypothetical protein
VSPSASIRAGFRTPARPQACAGVFSFRQSITRGVVHAEFDALSELIDVRCKVTGETNQVLEALALTGLAAAAYAALIWWMLGVFSRHGDE